MKKTEMYVELIVSNFSKDFDSTIKKIKEKPNEINIKGRSIISVNTSDGISKQLFDKQGKPRSWKESFIVYKVLSLDLNLESSLRDLMKIINKLKNSSSFNRAKFGIKCVIYLKDDRPNTCLNVKTIKTLARENCYLDIVLY